MSTRLRRKRANSLIWGFLALTMIGLGGYGVANFSGGVTELGRVGERVVSTTEYGRALQQELQAFTKQVGHAVDFEQARTLGIDRVVLSQVLGAATLENEAEKLGLSVGDAQVRERIVAAPALQGIDGKFDRDSYTAFLKQQGFSEVEFETTLRDEAARGLLQQAVGGGLSAPDSLVDRLTGWSSETRSFAFAELKAENLTGPVPAPADDQLKAWYDAHTDAYMRPETRRLTYIWLKPESLIDQVSVDEAALKATYDERHDEYVIPEKRMVSRLVYPSEAEAAAAKARLDAGTASFEDLVKERGLTPDDVDLGEVSAADLGAAGDAVWAMTEPGVVGPLASDLGPALFAMNGILPGEVTTFEEAQGDLRTELALERARRLVADKASEIEDMLASGATLAETAKEIGMETGQLAYNSDSEDGLAGYAGFREVADKVTAEDFPTLSNLDDGGVFAIQLDGIDAAAPRPIEEVKDKVATDWTKDATHSALLALAAEDLAQVQNGTALDAMGLTPVTQEKFARGGFVADVPAQIGTTVFDMAAAETRIIDAEGRVFLLTVTGILPADLKNPDVISKRDNIKAGLSASLGRDLFELYTKTTQTGAGVTLNQAAVEAVNSQMK